MKISIFAVGTRGDVQPCVALAKQLSNNFDVEILTHKEFKELVENNDIKFCELIGNPANNWDEDHQDLNFKEKLENFWRVWLEIGLKSCQTSDTIIFTPLFSIGNHLAEKLKIPYFPIIFEPNISTGEFPSPYLTNNKIYSPTLNKFTHNFAYYSFWLNIRKIVNKLRREILALPEAPLKGYFGKTSRNNINYLCCFSKHLVAKPKDWNENISFTGYWFLENNENIIFDDDLNEFFENKKPIFFDFGSFSHFRLKKITEIIFDDLRKTGEKLLIDPGKIDVTKFDDFKNVKIINSKIPHKFILPKVSMIITQSGIGTVHAALRAGVPIIPIPMIPAQYFWGNKAYNLGLGVKPIKIKNITPGKIYQSVNTIFENSLIKQNLNEMSKLINSENSLNNACSFIEANLNKINSTNI
ncbi:MAG: glycosyltransferase [Melioribacteraceae bacterium]